MSSSDDVTLAQGGLANRQGRILEATIIPTFKARGFEVVPFSQWTRAPGNFGKELLLTNAPYTTIYGHQGKTEFLVRSERYGLNIRVECKWQQSSGSVDEKFPYLFLNCIEAIPEEDIIIVYGGGGMKPGALRWLHSAVKESRYHAVGAKKKNIQVLSLDEFMVWANRTLR